MRKIIMTGRLTRDPELRELTSKEDEQKKLKRLTFGLANNDTGKDDPEFFDVVCWDRLATWGTQYLKKGTQILVEGVPHNDAYEKDGQKRTHFQITAERIELIG